MAATSDLEGPDGTGLLGVSLSPGVNVFAFAPFSAGFCCGC